MARIASRVDVQVERLADGLWWWTGVIEGRGELGCLYVESARAISLLDPVLPPEAPERFLEALDRDIARHGGPVDVFFTTAADSTLADGIVERYGAVIRTASTADVEIDADGFLVPAHRVRFAHRKVERQLDAK